MVQTMTWKDCTSIEEIQGNSKRNILIGLLVNNIPVNFKLDTGAECNIISMRLENELNAHIEPTTMLLKSLDTVGKCIIDRKVNEAREFNTVVLLVYLW